MCICVLAGCFLGSPYYKYPINNTYWYILIITRNHYNLQPNLPSQVGENPFEFFNRDKQRYDCVESPNVRLPLGSHRWHCSPRLKPLLSLASSARFLMVKSTFIIRTLVFVTLRQCISLSLRMFSWLLCGSTNTALQPRWLRSSSPCRPQGRFTASLRINRISLTQGCVNKALCVSTCVCTVCIFVSVCVCVLKSCKSARVSVYMCWWFWLRPDCAGMALPPCYSTDQTSENNKTTSNMIISPMKAQQKLFIPFVFLPFDEISVDVLDVCMRWGFRLDKDHSGSWTQMENIYCVLSSAFIELCVCMCVVYSMRVVCLCLCAKSHVHSCVWMGLCAGVYIPTSHCSQCNISVAAV